MGSHRIGFFGGSFDPPHHGHLVVARAAAAFGRLDRVLMAPTGLQPLKPHGSSASFADRLAMVELLCDGEDGLSASAIDAPRPDAEPNFTVDTLVALRASLADRLRKTPGDEVAVVCIVGADAFLGLFEWREPERLLDLAEWIVVTRPGVDRAQLGAMPLTTAQWAKVHLLEGVAEPASATAVRVALATGEDVSAVLPEAVSAYIRERQLYSS